MTEMTKDGLLRHINSLLLFRSQAELAREIGVSRSLISEVLRGKRRPTEKILNYIGVKERVTYIKTGKRK